jgi:hypothetical protein
VLVFYSGWGYWQYDSELLQKTIDCSPLQNECCWFELPKKAEKEITCQNKSIVSYLEISKDIDLIGPATNSFNSGDKVIGNLRFILCEEPKVDGNFTYEYKPAIKTTMEYTQTDTRKNSHVDDTAEYLIDTPKKQSETERNSMLKLIIGMAMDAYGYDPDKTRNDSTGNNKNSISAKMQTRGITISDDTIRKYLNEAKDLI